MSAEQKVFASLSCHKETQMISAEITQGEEGFKNVKGGVPNIL